MQNNIIMNRRLKEIIAALPFLLFIMALHTAMLAQPAITSIDNLKQNRLMTFRSADGKEYLVKQKNGSCDVSTRRSRRDVDNNTKFCDGDDFDGIARKAAKTSFAGGSAREIDNYKTFVQSLPDDEFMCETRDPAISKAATSNRVDEEKINVRVTGIWLYAFKRQKDEDYHLVVGISSNYSTAKNNKFYNMEISGHPEDGSDDFNEIKDSRDDFENFFGITNCRIVCRNYVDFKKNPIKIEIAGSMFYDKDHCSNLAGVSPSGYPIKTAWEVHPIKTIRFIEE